ncbi:hypothetical protein C8Q74DRAFT_1222760 [Fomes fomentarius]|nr:hypothetical protein C8Q74DRAFT_1222760 [Fomes fomentarius]
MLTRLWSPPQHWLWPQLCLGTNSWLAYAWPGVSRACTMISTLLHSNATDPNISAFPHVVGCMNGNPCAGLAYWAVLGGQAITTLPDNPDQLTIARWNHGITQELTCPYTVNKWSRIHTLGIMEAARLVVPRASPEREFGSLHWWTWLNNPDATPTPSWWSMPTPLVPRPYPLHHSKLGDLNEGHAELYR